MWIQAQVPPLSKTSDEEMERGFSEWRRMNVIVWMYVCYKIWKINKKSGIMPPNIKVFFLTKITVKKDNSNCLIVWTKNYSKFLSRPPRGTSIQTEREGVSNSPEKNTPTHHNLKSFFFRLRLLFWSSRIRIRIKYEGSWASKVIRYRTVFTIFTIINGAILIFYLTLRHWDHCKHVCLYNYHPFHVLRNNLSLKHNFLPRSWSTPRAPPSTT